MGYMCYNKITKKILDFIDVKVDEYIEYEGNQLGNNSSANPVNNDENNDESPLDELNEIPPNPQAK